MKTKLAVVRRGCQPKLREKKSGTYKKEQMRLSLAGRKKMCKLFKKVEFRSYELGNSMLFAENTQGKIFFMQSL